MTLDEPLAFRVLTERRKEQHVALTLVIPLVMKMLHILRQRMAERCFPKEDEPREAFLLDRSHPAFRVGVQMRRPRRQGHPRAPGGVHKALERWTVRAVPVVDERLAGGQEAPLFHRHITSHLDHPRFIGMRRDAGSVDFPAANVDEKQHVLRHEPTQRPDLSGKAVGGHQHSICVRINSRQVVVVLRSGAGGTPWRLRMLPTVWSLMVYPRLARAPTIRS